MPNGTLQLTWADGEHKFNIAKIGQILELEEKCDAGVAVILERLRSSTWQYNDVREVIRLGLIGGGMKPEKAIGLIKRYVDDRPWAESVPVAFSILGVAMFGTPKNDPVGKGQADRAATEATMTGASFDPQSTAREPQSDLPRGTLTS